MTGIKFNAFTLSGAALLLALTLAPAVAQETEFNIEAQPLAKALLEFNEQSGLTVAARRDLVADKTAPAVHGEMEPEVALERILSGTDLKSTQLSSGGYTITADAADLGKYRSGRSPVPMARNQIVAVQSQTAASRSEATRSGRSDERGAGIVTGKVTDARTGANLKGAKVTIEETGQWTSTNDLGEFRFVNVPMGSATLIVSFLGYAEQSAIVSVHENGVTQAFALRGGSEIEEIVVFGQRSARANALNQERTAQNFTTVLSADMLGRFEGTTIAESLRRAPGIAFQQDERSGDGTNIIIRGLSADFNQVNVNGLRLPESSGRGRSPNLSNILTESISKISISKTLLPSQDGAGTGGLVEIETKKPLDRPRRFASFNARIGESAGDFRDDGLMSGTASGIFGAAERFAASISLQYRESDVKSVRYNIDSGLDPFVFYGEYLPLGADGSILLSPSSIDPRRSFPFEDGAPGIYPRAAQSSVSQVEVSNLNTTVSLQWKPTDNASIVLDYTRTELEEDERQANASFSPSMTYLESSIPELGGDTRGALFWEDAIANFGIPGLAARVQQGYELKLGDKQTTDILSIDGSASINDWTYDVTIGYAKGETDNPFNSRAFVNPTGGFFNFGLYELDRSLLVDDIETDNTLNGLITSAYRPLSGREFPLPLLNQQGFAVFNNPETYALESIDVRSIRGENERATAKFDIQYNMSNKALKYVKAGFFYEDFTARSLFSPGQIGRSATGVPLSLPELGLGFANNPLSSIGRNGGFSTVPLRDLEQFARSAKGNSSLAFTDRDFDERNLDAFTTEEDIAIYAEGQINIGKVEIIGGVRMERVTVDARNLTNPRFRDEFGNRDLDFEEQFKRLVNQSATQEQYLPRMLLNYRHTDNAVFRVGFFQTVARPRIQDLSTEQDILLDLRPIRGAAGDQPLLQIREGNPALKPAKTDNYDLSLELYDDDIGAIKFSLFYKSIKNFLEFNATQGTDQLAGAVLPDDPRFLIENLPDNILVERVRPFNNDQPAEIWGGELAIEKQLRFLPPAFSGLGVYTNYTYTESQKKVFDQYFDPVVGELVDIQFDDVSFRQQPKHSGTIAVTYNDRGFDGSLSFTKQSRRLTSFDDFGLSAYADSDESLDFRLEYFLDGYWRSSWRFYVEGADLLKGNRDPDVEVSIGGEHSVPRIYTRGSFLGGRVVRVGLSGTFQ